MVRNRNGVSYSSLHDDEFLSQGMRIAMQRSRIINAIILLSTLLLFTTHLQATACSCLNRTIVEDFAVAKAVVVGVVTEHHGRIVFPDMRRTDLPYELYTLTVEQRWKGPSAMQLPIAVNAGPGPSCGTEVRLGERLLLFGESSWGSDTVGLSRCSRQYRDQRISEGIRELSYSIGGQWAIAANPGAAAIDNDDWKIGYDLGAGLRYVLMPHLSLRARLGYSYLPFDFQIKFGGAALESSSGREMRIISLSAEAVLRGSADHHVVSPYIAVGPIMTWYEIGDALVDLGRGSLAVEGSSYKAFGLNGGLGIDFPLGARTTWFIEGRTAVNLEDVPLNSVVISAVTGVQVLL
jgi:hypothetical protein